MPHPRLRISDDPAGAPVNSDEENESNVARFPFDQHDLASPLFSPRGEAKCVKSPSEQGARRWARGSVLEQYVEHGEQAQRSNGGLFTHFASSGGEKCGLVLTIKNFL